MFANRTELEDHIRAWVELITGLDCFVQNKMGPAPDGTFATVFIASIKQPEHDLQALNADRTQETVRGFSRVTCDVSVWGVGASNHCDTLRTSLNSEERTLDLYTRVGKGSIGDVMSVSSDFRGVIEERSEFRVVFWACLPKSFATSYFNQVSGTVGVQQKGQTFDFNVGPVT